MSYLMVGSTGNLVKELQTKLNQVLKPVPLLQVDGIFGTKTNAAVRAFQAKERLAVDGIVGPMTQSALDAARKNPVGSMSIFYTVPGYIHIAQDKTMSCWFASAQMLIQWKRNRTKTTDSRHPDPSDTLEWSKLYQDNTGITNGKIREFAKDMGFAYVPPMSPTPEAILGWLRTYGPLWVNGVKHITVIAGIRGPRENTEVLVLDPGRPAEKSGAWRNLQQWYILDKHSGRDSASEVEAVFLRLP